MQMPGRKFTQANSSYRYGFNGHEKSMEIDPNGNSMTAEFWQYDARIGRRWNVDIVKKHYESPYASFANNPICFVDLYGLDTSINGNLYHDLEGVTVTAKYKPKVYSTGNVTENSREDDLTKSKHNVDINTSLYDKNNPYERDAIRNHLSQFTTAFHLGTILESTDAQDEASQLVTHFETGGGAMLPLFSPSSAMAGILREDDQFLEMVEQFESNLVNHLKRTGSLEGFSGNDIFGVARQGKYIKDTWFMHTVMGGFKQVDAQIQIVTANQIKVRYTLWDHFGAGTNDATSSTIGLPSLYWLQHNSAENNILMSNWFTPFIWGIQVDRTITK